MRTKVYFADLTYNTGVLSCDLFPLGCGYVASYAKELFGSDCEINIFKYIDELLETAEENPPDILASSFYVWNRNLTLEVSSIIKKINPDCLIVFGGLAFPLDAKRQKEFLLDNKIIDFFIPYDGEVGFSSLLHEYFKADASLEKMKKINIKGVIYLDSHNELIIGEAIKRPENLDIFPSPYLTGLFDKFFKEKKFTPMIQTTRGCPHTCAYCWASNERNRCISFFSLDRVKAELNYIAEAATKNNTYDLVISDSNFGLSEKDYEIVDAIAALQEKYNYPRVFGVPYGKKSNPEVVKRFCGIKGARYCFSTQSTDPKILRNIKRREVGLKLMKEYVKAVHDLKKYIATEIITGLPYETRQTHLKTIRDLLDCGFDFIDPFTFMLLDGIELNSDEACEKFKYDVRYRLIPRNFGKIRERYCFEIEKVVVGTDTYNFDDYIYFRSFHGLLRLILNNGIYKELLRYIENHGIHLMDWFIFVFDDLRNTESQASKCFDAYVEEVHSELWESPEALKEYYSKDENYAKLLTRERGDNLMQKHGLLASSLYFELYVEYFIRMAECYLVAMKEVKKDDISRELMNIKKFILSKLSGLFTKKLQKTVFFKLDYDILSWIDDGFERPLSDYKLERPKLAVAELSDEQVAFISKIFKRYDFDRKNPYALYRTSVLVQVDNYFRKIKWAENENGDLIESGTYVLMDDVKEPT